MNKKAMSITVSTAMTGIAVSIATSVTVVVRYRNQFKKLSESMSCLNKMRQDFEISLNPIIVMESEKILKIIDNDDCDIKMGFRKHLTIMDIIKFQKAGITIKVLEDLDNEIRKLISYTYMRYGINTL